MREAVTNESFKDRFDVLFGLCDKFMFTSARIKLPSPDSLNQEMFSIRMLRFRIVVAGRILRVT